MYLRNTGKCSRMYIEMNHLNLILIAYKNSKYLYNEIISIFDKKCSVIKSRVVRLNHIMITSI